MLSTILQPFLSQCKLMGEKKSFWAQVHHVMCNCNSTKSLETWTEPLPECVKKKIDVDGVTITGPVQAPTLFSGQAENMLQHSNRTEKEDHTSSSRDHDCRSHHLLHISSSNG